MKLELVMAEVAARTKQLISHQVYDYPPMTIVAPCGVVSYPESLDYDQTYGRGMDKITGLPVILLAGKASVRESHKTVAGWAAGSGPTSLKEFLERQSYDSCDTLVVTTCEFDVVEIAAIDYMAAMFTLDITGDGRS